MLGFGEKQAFCCSSSFAPAEGGLRDSPVWHLQKSSCESWSKLKAGIGGCRVGGGCERGAVSASGSVCWALLLFHLPGLDLGLGKRLEKPLEEIKVALKVPCLEELFACLGRGYLQVALALSGNWPGTETGSPLVYAS